MKRVICSILTAAALIGVLASFGRPLPRHGSPLSEIIRAAAGGSVDPEGLGDRRGHDDERVKAELLSKLRQRQAGTYIDEILLGRDSALARWPNRTKPLTVWIQPTAELPDWIPDLVPEVRKAFEEWGSARLPLRFRFVPDSVRAEIHVTWVDRFDEPISGRTRWARDEKWWITDASIVLAVHHHKGATLDLDSVRAMALHEVGHLLGLDHATDASNIMAPRVRVRSLSDADRATVELLYSLPAGALR